MKTTERRLTPQAQRRSLGPGTIVHADVTLRSASGKSIHKEGATILSTNIAEFFAPEGAQEQAESRLRDLGLDVVAGGPTVVCVAAPCEKFETLFGVHLSLEPIVPQAAPGGLRQSEMKGYGMQLLNDGERALPVPASLSELVESIDIGAPIVLCASPTPPNPDYFHVSIPDGLARLVDAVQCHQRGIKGQGITLVVPDHGTFIHPYYTAQGYDMTVDQTVYVPSGAEEFHGTIHAGEALAIAPGVRFIAVRVGDLWSGAGAAFLYAVQKYHPDVINLSWGAPINVPAFRALLAWAIAQGIVVCAACGNDQYLMFPSSYPEVISVGGTYADELDRLQASSSASSGMLKCDPGRQMPDLTGYVGQGPKSVYITEPCPPGCELDQQFAPFDQTERDDGWAIGGATSGATMQVSGVACLYIQKFRQEFGRKPTPGEVKEALQKACTDVIEGKSANGELAGPGWDKATGYGVVDAFVAVNGADVWLRDCEGDTGLVPSRGQPYTCPDLKVLAAELQNNPQEADFEAAEHVERPIAGTRYYIYVNARNRGIAPAQKLSVKLYYADPQRLSLLPGDWNDGQSGVPDQGTLEPNVIEIPAIPHRQSRVAGPFVWTPPDPSNAVEFPGPPFFGEYRGRFVLAARLDCEDDPSVLPAGDLPAVRFDNNAGVRAIWVRPGVGEELEIALPVEEPAVQRLRERPRAPQPA